MHERLVWWSCTAAPERRVNGSFEPVRLAHASKLSANVLHCGTQFVSQSNKWILRNNCLHKACAQVQIDLMLVKEIFAIADVRVPVKRKKTLDPGKVDDIAEDMLENGQTTPIRLRTGKSGGYVLISGYHRLEALRALGEDKVEGYLVHARLH